MKIDEETTFSMRVSWQPVDPRNVRHYRLSYISARGDRAAETVRPRETLYFRIINVKSDAHSNGLQQRLLFIPSISTEQQYLSL